MSNRDFNTVRERIGIIFFIIEQPWVTHRNVLLKIWKNIVSKMLVL